MSMRDNAKPATLADLAMPELRDPETGILCRVLDHVIPLLLAGDHPATIETFADGDTVFSEGQESDFPIYVILSGKFEVIRTLIGAPDEAKGMTFTTETAPHVMGDVEFFVRGVDPVKYGRGKVKNKAISTTTCKENGSTALVLPQPLLLALMDSGEASQLMYNLARAVSIKLLRRGVEAERQMRHPHERIILELGRILARAEAEGRIEPNIGVEKRGDKKPKEHERKMTLHKWMVIEPKAVPAVIEESLGIHNQTVRNLFTRLDQENLFFCNRNRMEFSPEFLRVIKEEPEAFFKYGRMRKKEI